MVKHLSGDARVLTCDYDGRRPPSIVEIRSLMNRLGVRVEWLRFDRTRRGWHMIVRLRLTLSPAERICFEALLGSDLHRCALDLMREMAVRRGRFSNFWRRRTSLLFERKLAS